MKILKPGKVEMRKFVCNKCGCVFVARKTEMLWTIYGLRKCCPTCYESHEWDNGEPYEETTQCDLKRLNDIIREWNWWSNGTCGFAQYLLDNGVTFREG